MSIATGMVIGGMFLYAPAAVRVASRLAFEAAYHVMTSRIAALFGPRAANAATQTEPEDVADLQ